MKMIESKASENIIIAGKWRFSLDYGIVRSPRRKPLLLEPRLARLIYYLGLNANTVVSRKYLLDHIWVETIVNEESLTRAVSDLRKTIAPHFRDSLVIETVPKRGYKLSLKTTESIIKITPLVSHVILGFIVFVLLIWFLADLSGVVETKFINSKR